MEKDFLLDDLLWDKFELPLNETSADDYYTVEEIKQEVEKRIHSLSKLGQGYKISATQITKYIITDRVDITAGTKPIANGEYLFVISTQAARKRNERFLDTIIYHELCHILQFEFLFSADIIYFEDGKRKVNPEHQVRANAWLLADGGHTDIWYIFVRKVNSAFAINPPVDKTLSNKDISDIFLENTFKQEGLELDFDGFYEYVDWDKIRAYRASQQETK